MKYVLVPISTIGCGKSTTFRTLTQLYPAWAHVENDNCDSKRDFHGKIASALKDHNVVLLDRNNHLELHRKQIVETFKGPEVVLVALEFVDSQTKWEKLRALTFERVETRGDNHQNIAARSQKGLARSIMSRFIKDFCPLADHGWDSMFDHRLKMNMDTNSSLINAELILKTLHSLDPFLVPQIPNEEQIRLSHLQSLEYKTKERRPQSRTRENSQRHGTRENSQRPGSKGNHSIKKDYWSSNKTGSGETADFSKKCAPEKPN